MTRARVGGPGSTTMALLVILIATCTTPRAEPPYALFVTPESDFFDNTERVALVPLESDDDLEVPDSVVTEFESLLRGELEQAGFHVIPSLVYEELWIRVVQDVGGIFDPYTGRRDDERFQRAVDRLREELKENFEPDVLLRPELWVVDAPFHDAVARWDGTSQDISTSRFRFGQDGFVLALTFGIVVEDLEGIELYVNGGGIEVLETLESVVPTEALFADRERIRNAVLTALEPLTRVHPEAPAKR